MTPRSLLIFEKECLPAMNPVWSSEMIKGIIGPKQRAKIFASIFTSTGRREIGLYDAQFKGSLSFLWMREMEACLKVAGREP